MQPEFYNAPPPEQKKRFRWLAVGALIGAAVLLLREHNFGANIGPAGVTFCITPYGCTEFYAPSDPAWFPADVPETADDNPPIEI